MESSLPPDPYAALGVPKDADPSTIKSTYKKLALKFHPDKVTDESKKPEATEKFHKIQRAYDIIGDEDERARYDAQVKLASLRRQNIGLRGSGPRFDIRTAGFDIRTAAPSYSAAFPTPRVYTEERRPSFYDDDEPQRSSSRKFDYSYSYSYTKRNAPKEKEEKRERVRVNDEERKRAERERRRDADVRESRSRKYAAYVDDEYARLESERRQRDKEEEARRKEETPRRGSFRGEDLYEDERKYADAQRYMAAQSRTEDVWPATSRPSASREVPYTHVRRTTASPEKTRRSPPTPQNQNAASPRDLKDSKENLRPPLRSHTTQTDSDPRKQAENDPPPVSIPRARTMPTMPTIPTSSATKKTESKHSQPPRGRTNERAAQPDSALPEGLYTYKQYSPPPPQAPPATSYSYSKQTATENTTPRTESGNKFDKYAASAGYRTEIREPGTSSRRVPSPQREREVKPSTTAAKMAHLVGGSSRAHVSPTSRPSPYLPYVDTASGRPSMVQQSSSRSTPRVSRSPEHVSERVRERDRERLFERDRSRDHDRRYEKLYGEMGPGYVRSTQANGNTYIEDGVKYSRRPRPEDVIYSSKGRRGSRDGPLYDGQRMRPQLNRSSTMPAVYAGV